SPDAQIGSGCTDQLLDLRQDQIDAGRRRIRGNVVGQPFTLLGIEDREALEERDGTWCLALVIGLLSLIVRDEAVGIDDRRPPFALAHVAAKPQSLPEREPALDGEAVLYDGTPEDQNVDARVAAPGGSIPGDPERRTHIRR